MTSPLSRRRFLSGAVQGASLYMALPLLDCYLNGNGTALASGAPLPKRFGTWHWGCGVNADRWVPSATGKDFKFQPEMLPLEPYRNQLCVLSGFNVALDGRPNFVHHTGNLGIRAGAAPTTTQTAAGETFDVTISKQLGAATRFRSIDVAASGDPKHSYSYLSSTIASPAEVSPVALYARIFGSEFQDPNKAEFTPDPKIMLRKSVLSAVKEERQAFVRGLGSDDRARLDQYFTSVRELEQQLALQLEKPAPAEACVRMSEPDEKHPGTDIETVMYNHDVMMRLLAMAMACNQTRVFNMVFSDAASTLRKAGSSVTHHLMTHEEPVDPALGYQPMATWFVDRAVHSFASALKILSDIREGDGTLLDNTLIFAHSDCNLAKIHEVEGVPMLLVGGAGGKLRGGQHIAGNGGPASRVGLTVQQLMGVPIDSWGSGSMQTNSALTDLIA